MNVVLVVSWTWWLKEISHKEKKKDYLCVLCQCGETTYIHYHATKWINAMCWIVCYCAQQGFIATKENNSIVSIVDGNWVRWPWCVLPRKTKVRTLRNGLLLRQMISPSDGLLSFRWTWSLSVTSLCNIPESSLGAEKSWQRHCFHVDHNKAKLEAKGIIESWLESTADKQIGCRSAWSSEF